MKTSLLRILVCLIIPLVLTGCGQKPTYNIIDVHEHIQSLSKADELLKVNESLGITKTIFLASPVETLTLNGNKSFTQFKENAVELSTIKSKYPEKTDFFCTLPPNEGALEYLKECLNNGGIGLKLYNGHSYYYDIFKEPLDSSKMLPIYDYCEKNGVPILFHVNINNYENELERLLSKYPKLRIDIPHYMVSSKNLDRVSQILTRYSSVYTDVSFGSPEYMASGIHRSSKNAKDFRNFIFKHSDRILFGSDMVLTDHKSKNPRFMTNVLGCYKDMLESKTYNCKPANEYYTIESMRAIVDATDCTNDCDALNDRMTDLIRKEEESRTLIGFNLPHKILNQIYEVNPQTFLGLPN